MKNKQFSPSKRQFSKQNYINVVEYYVPEYYRTKDEEAGTQVSLFSTLINSHLNIANYISSILPLTDGSTYTGLDEFSGIAKFFIKQNFYTYIEPKDFEIFILNKDNKSFKDFNSSASFQDYVANTLIPKIQTNDPSLSSIDYLIDNLGWFYFLAGSSTFSYQPSTTVVEAFNTLYNGGSLAINDGINALTKFVWNNYSALEAYSVIPENYRPDSYLASSNTYTSGTQNLDRLFTLNDILYSTYLTDIQDETVKDAFEAYEMTSLFLTDRESSGAFRRLLRAFSFGFRDLQDPVDQLNVIYDINNCPAQYLQELANLIGWKLYGYDPEKWRLQLINAVSIYKKTGTKQSLQAALDSIFTPGVIDIDSYVYELWESYLPFLILYSLATESTLLTDLSNYTRDVAYRLNVDTYSSENIEDNLYIIVDNILGRLMEEFPETFTLNLNGQDQFNYRGRTLNFPPFEQINYYTKCSIHNNFILRVIDYLVCFGVPQAFAEQVGDYIRTNTVDATDDIREDNSWLIFTSGHNIPPNWNDVINNPTNKREEYLSMWSGKSSHYKLVFNASSFNFLSKSYDAESAHVVRNISQVANDFSPAHAIQHSNLVIADSDVAEYTDFDDNIVIIDKTDFFSDTSSSNTLSNYFASGLSMSAAGFASSTRYNRDSLSDFDTTAVSFTPRNTIRRRNFKNTLDYAGFYDRTGFNQPTNYATNNAVEVILTKDTDGIVHIDTEGDMKYGYYGLGFSHAKDLGDVYLLKYILHSGRGLQFFPDNFPTSFSSIGGNVVPGCFYWNASGTVLTTSSYCTSSLSSLAITQDFYHLREDAQTYYDTMPYRYQTALNHYTKGFNKAINVHRDRLAVSSLVGPALETHGAFDFKITPIDVILATQWFTAEGTIKGALVRANNYITNTEDDEDPVLVGGEFLKSSNQWAVRGTITDTGRPMNLIDPHLATPIGGDYSYQLFPAAIRCSDFEWFGGGPVGTLFMALGGNRWLSYSLTANSPLHSVLYHVDSNSNYQYSSCRTSGTVSPASSTISIETSGSPITYIFKDTTHGRMLSNVSSINEAVTVAHNLRGAHQLLQFMQMADSQSLDEFNTFYGKQHSLGYNCIVATNEGTYGNIQYCHGGRVRKMRDETTYDFRSHVVDGNVSATDWINSLTTNQVSYSNDATFYSFFNNELPVLVNPDAGYLVCNNASPSLVTRDCPLSNADYTSSIIVSVSDDNPITNNRQDRARFLFDSTLSSGGTIDYDTFIAFSLDKYTDLYPRNVAYWQRIFDVSADTFYVDSADKNAASALLAEWALFDGYTVSTNTVQPEIEYYYQAVVPFVMALYSLDTSSGILSGLTDWSGYYSAAFSSLSINGPGERVTVSAWDVMRLATNFKASPTDLVDLLPIAGGADALDSHGYTYSLALNRFINGGGILFNSAWKYNQPGYLPTIKYRFPSPATTYINPSTRAFAETYTSSLGHHFASGVYLDLAFSSLPDADRYEKFSLKPNEPSSYTFLGFNPSSLTYVSAVNTCSSLSTIPDVYAGCIDFDSSATFYGLAVSTSYPVRGFFEGDLSSFQHLAVQRDTDPFIKVLFKIGEEAKKQYYKFIIQQDLSAYSEDMLWKDVSSSMANTATNCSSGEFPSSHRDYYNMSLGKNLMKWYRYYIKEFGRHPTRWDVINSAGPNIFAHTFGWLNENYDFHTQASSLGFYASAASEVITLNPSHTAFIDASAGAVVSTGFKVLLNTNTKEINNSSVIGSWTLVNTSGANEYNSFNIFNLVKAYAEEKVFNNTIVKLKSTNGFPRLKAVIPGLDSVTIDSVQSSNFLLPNCKYKITVDGLAANENGLKLEDCELGICIHTSPENNQTWVYNVDGKWQLYDLSSVTKDMMLTELSHIQSFEAKDRQTNRVNNKFNFLCASAAFTNQNNMFTIGAFKDDEFTILEYSFDTNNCFLDIPYNYSNVYGAPHRQDQAYEIEVFLVPTSRDKFVILNSVALTNETLSLLAKYEVTGVPTGIKNPRFCNPVYVDLTTQDMKAIVDFFNRISGKGSGNGINSRDSVESSGLNDQDGGYRASYRDNPYNSTYTRHGTAPNDYGFSEIEF